MVTRCLRGDSTHRRGGDFKKSPTRQSESVLLTPEELELGNDLSAACNDDTISVLIVGGSGTGVQCGVGAYLGTRGVSANVDSDKGPRREIWDTNFGEVRNILWDFSTDRECRADGLDGRTGFCFRGDEELTRRMYVICSE